MAEPTSKGEIPALLHSPPGSKVEAPTLLPGGLCINGFIASTQTANSLQSWTPSSSFFTIPEANGLLYHPHLSGPPAHLCIGPWFSVPVGDASSKDYRPQLICADSHWSLMEEQEDKLSNCFNYYCKASCNRMTFWRSYFTCKKAKHHLDKTWECFARDDKAPCLKGSADEFLLEKRSREDIFTKEVLPLSPHKKKDS